MLAPNCKQENMHYTPQFRLMALPSRYGTSLLKQRLHKHSSERVST